MQDLEQEVSELLRATACSDRAAFTRLYQIAAPKLFGIALRICQDRAVAEDALQEAFVEIWRKAQRFDPVRGSALGWVSVIARNRAIDLVRRHGRGSDTADLDHAVMVPEAAQTVEHHEDYLSLLACLSELDERSRDAVLRAYYLGETRENLAQRFAVPTNTVKTWLRRGLASLKGCLDR